MIRLSRISYFKKYFRDLFHLPSILSSLTLTNAQHAKLLHELSQQLDTLQHSQDSLLKKYQKLSEEIAAARQTIDVTKGTRVDKAFSDNHQFDEFYKAFEDEFRGAEDVILHRLKEYIPLIESLSQDIKQLPVLDIGCGRGEFLSLLKSNGFIGIGVDTNETMVKHIKAKGFTAYATDAFDYLSHAENDSLAMITGFHIVEHIPFESLMAMFSECYRTLATNGCVLFETPNPETFSVGAHTFYLDPSHLHPIPPQLLAFILEYVGFTCEIKRLHPVEELSESLEPHLEKLYTAAFGSADYAVIGRKIVTTDS